jgi:RHS repeat-associated protein
MKLSGSAAFENESCMWLGPDSWLTIQKGHERMGAPAFSQQQVWSYTYDASGNRTAAQEGSRSGTATYNNLNQFTGLVGGGITWFRGTVNEAANVTISGQNARVYADGTFESLMNLGAGVHDVPLQATDKAGNITNQTWRVNNGPAGTVVPTHDTEGNVLTDGTRTYTWDAKNRMASVAQLADAWAFTFDGGSRRVKETKNGALVREWVWSGKTRLEERLADGTKHRFWYGGIEIVNASNQQTGKRLVLKDHLGSARLVVNGATGGVLASYDYSPWGKRAKISGTEEWSTGYTGHGWHESGMSLAVYRPYDPDTGRWLSRDPIEEEGGLNLYGYVGNGPVMEIDPLGLMEWHEAFNWYADHGGTAANDFMGGFSNSWLMGAPNLIYGAADLQGADPCSGWTTAGDWTATGIGLAAGAKGAAGIAQRAKALTNSTGSGVRRLFADPRKFTTISKQVRSNTGLVGNKEVQLGHLWFRNSSNVSPALKGAGLNYAPMTASINSWLGNHAGVEMALRVPLGIGVASAASSPFRIGGCP